MLEKQVFSFLENDHEFKEMIKSSKFVRLEEIPYSKISVLDRIKFMSILEDRYQFAFPWIIGGLGTATLSNKSNAKSVKTCPIKCPTFNEA